MRPWWLVVTLVGLLVLGASLYYASKPAIGPREQRVFEAVNGLPDWLYWPLWPPMQLGNLVVGTAAGLLVAIIHRHLGVAIGVVLAMLLKLVAERIVRREMRAALAIRQRPGTSEIGAVLRGSDVPKTGPSFPSGHVILVAGIGIVVAPLFAATWWWLPLVAIALVMLGRVYVGAHNPLDVTAGLGAGLILGGIVASLVG